MKNSRLWNRLFAAIFVLFISTFTVNSASPLKVHFIDVGQADSILVQTPAGQNLLIDGGNRADGPAVLAYLKASGVKRLDAVIATHPHEDHIGGLPTVINALPVSSFYMPNKEHTTTIFKDMIAAVMSSGAKRIQAKAGVDLGLTGVSATLLAPISTAYADLNEYSAVLRLVYGDTSFLFMGDAGVESEGQILASGTEVSSTFLKVGHHGSRTASSERFVNEVKPKYAVLSVGMPNDYGLPDEEPLARLAAAGTKLYRTDRDGTIVATSDGKAIVLSTAKAQVQEASTLVKSGAVAGKAGKAGATAVVSGVGLRAPGKSPAVTVYITRTGEKYHLAGCRYLARSQILIHLPDAKAQGFEPCSVCSPPR